MYLASVVKSLSVKFELELLSENILLTNAHILSKVSVLFFLLITIELNFNWEFEIHIFQIKIIYHQSKSTNLKLSEILHWLLFVNEFLCNHKFIAALILNMIYDFNLIINASTKLYLLLFFYNLIQLNLILY